MSSGLKARSWKTSKADLGVLVKVRLMKYSKSRSSEIV